MDFTNFDWEAYDAIPSQEELMGTKLRDWFQRQYVRELENVMSYNRNKYNRMGMIAGWRIERHISMWTALPGEKRPEKWERKPTEATMKKQAQEAWARCDITKAQKLYDMWHHDCMDPYYCPMHGIGSD
jgi:hypothetical protein